MLLASPAQHRIVEEGENTERLYRAVTRFAELSLLPPSRSALGCDIFVALSLDLPPMAAAVLGIVTAAGALGVWYGLSTAVHYGILKDRPMKAHKKGSTPLHAKIEQMLTEARVVLPGAQALLGFQFIAVFTQPFRQISFTDKTIHFMALLAIASCVVLLLAPAAVHRLAFNGRDEESFHRLGSAIISLAMLPLAVGLACDVYVALRQILEQPLFAATAGILAFGVLIILWYGVPVVVRFRVARNGRRS